MIDFDVSELHGLAAVLDAAPEQASKAAHQAGIAVATAVQKAAKAAAPRDRPWLATDGIRRRSWRTKGSSHSDVFTVEDERGVNVGFEVEFGNSVTPPNPFLGNQMVWAGPAFEEAVIAGIEPLAGP